VSDNITILRAHGRRLTKVIHADGTIDDYDKSRTVDLTQVRIDGLKGIEPLLHRLERHSDCCVVRGAIADPTRVLGVRRLLYRDLETGDEPTLTDVPRRWLALDFDSLPRPNWIEPTDLLGCACVAIRKLPAEFQQATFIVQATAGHALKPGIRIRLWAWLSRLVTGLELKYWLRSAPVDQSIFGAGQVVYVARPVFLPGAFDPLPARLDVIPGCGEVAVPSPERLKPPPLAGRLASPPGQADISGLVHAVANAVHGNRNALLYWAACRIAEADRVNRNGAAALLEQAAVQAGLSAAEAAATISSALRRGADV
jgi:hypothetical protein